MLVVPMTRTLPGKAEAAFRVRGQDAAAQPVVATTQSATLSVPFRACKLMLSNKPLRRPNRTKPLPST